MKREDLRKILRGKCVTDAACEAAIDELLKAKLSEQVDPIEFGIYLLAKQPLRCTITNEQAKRMVEQFKKERL